jgi:hypothetical protein
MKQGAILPSEAILSTKTGTEAPLACGAYNASKTSNMRLLTKEPTYQKTKRPVSSSFQTTAPPNYPSAVPE